MVNKNLLNSFKEQGLICFEEITDYSILDINTLKNKRKNLDDDDDSNSTSKKKKKTSKSHQKSNDVDAKSVNKKKKSTKQLGNKKKSSKSVRFNEEVTVLNKKNQKLAPPAGETAAAANQENDVEVSQEETTPKEKIKKEKKTKKSSNTNNKKKSKKTKKLNKTNSTSRLSMHDPAAPKLEDFNDEDLEKKMEPWSDMLLPKILLRSLYDKCFYEPMPIQKLVLPEAIKNKSNIIGTAQTGSGKTLAFGLPILTGLVDSYESNISDEKPVNTTPQALILTPTRELAIQIKEHLQICCKYQKINIVVVVGGISQLKQERLLKKKPEIIVATPGRLMQMIEEGNEYLSEIGKIKYLVIDEADRMIEKGHFSEMEKILGLVNSDEKLKMKRQNFLFSATLISTLTMNTNNNNNGNEHRAKTELELEKDKKATLKALIERVQMIKEPKVFDLTTKALTADNLTESKILCNLNEKDIYLYYFSCKYSGRTLVFANSIDCVRRLTNLFRYLKKAPLHLHANMNQKQRCKNLEKFNEEENSLLIASDVASRGLDIPGVMHVIHYQVPRSAEIYVHRSGRTARSNNQGLSVMLMSPDEQNLYKKILSTFNKDKDLKDYPIDLDYFDECKKRVQIARKIDELEHQLNKERSTTNWYEKHAKMLDIELDDELLKETYVDNEKNSKSKRQLKSLKNQLDSELKKLILPRFMSKSYLKTENIKRVDSMNETNKSALNEMKELNQQKKNKQKNNKLKLA